MAVISCLSAALVATSAPLATAATNDGLSASLSATAVEYKNDFTGPVDPALVQRLTAEYQALPKGGTMAMGTQTVGKTAQGLPYIASIKDGPQFPPGGGNPGPCTTAVSAAILGIGAAGLGVLAAIGAPVVIAGLSISAYQLGVLAAATGGVAAIQGYVALYIC